MTRELVEKGFDEVQSNRYDAALSAAKAAVLSMLCWKYDADLDEIRGAFVDSRRLYAEFCALLERMELSPAFVAHVHSNHEF